MRYLFFILLNALLETKTQSVKNLRDKRQVNSLPLVFPYGGTYKLIIGFSAPVANKDNINFAFTGNFQYQYAQFQNITELSQYYFIKEVSREEREADLLTRRDERLVFYNSVVNMMDSRGFSGMQCLLRAICEAAQYPVADEGLIGEIVHILLTPDYGKTPFDDDVGPEWNEAMSEYSNAATAGRQMFSCGSIYSECKEGEGLMELISTLTDE